MSLINNYLDDFLFVAATLLLCNFMIQEFLDMCQELGIPIALDKTEWAQIQIIFLDILLDCQSMSLVILEEKRTKAIAMLTDMLNRKKVTIKDLQLLCGYLNFLNKAVIPGRVFTRRMYAQFSGVADFNRIMHHKGAMVRHFNKTEGYMLKLHHHIRLNQEFKLNCEVWLSFLTNPDLSRVVNRPILDVSQHCTSNQISFYSDASRAVRLGFGCILNKQWLFGQWPEGFINQEEPSIEFLELFALTVGVLTWEDHLSLTNTRVTCLWFT